MKRFLKNLFWIIPFIFWLYVAIGVSWSLRECNDGYLFFTKVFTLVFSTVVLVTTMCIQIWFKGSLSRKLNILIVLTLGSWVLFAILLPNLIGVAPFHQQQVTMKRMIKVDKFIQGINRFFPLSPLSSLPEWKEAEKKGLAPPSLDGWQHPFVVGIVSGRRFVLSSGACGDFDEEILDEEIPRATLSIKDDVLMKDGVFIRYPENVAALFDLPSNPPSSH